MRPSGLGAAPDQFVGVFPTGRQASAKARAFAGFIEARLSKDESAPRSALSFLSE
jgi:hypothetical protein